MVGLHWDSLEATSGLFGANGQAGFILPDSKLQSFPNKETPGGVAWCGGWGVSGSCIFRRLCSRLENVSFCGS